jgi:hypothetical protein
LNADDTEVLYLSQYDLTDKNIFLYCDNNPTSREDSGGFFWSELALAGGGSVGVGLVISSVIVPFIPIIGQAVLVGVVVGVVVGYGIRDYKVHQAQKKERSNNYPAARRKYNSRKEAYQEAKRAGKNREPRHDPHGHKNNKKPHFHPDVPNSQKLTPKNPCYHDHYYY